MPLQATSGAASYDAFGGGVVAEPNYIESVFSTWLYSGTGASQTITNGIDLSTKGGLVWIKQRNLSQVHVLVDTVRGNNKRLQSNSTAAEDTTSSLMSFNADGFSVPNNYGITNQSDQTYVSWTFRKQPKMFDIQTWTGSGANRTIAHALGSVPGCIIVKRTDTTGEWQVYHRSLANTEYLVLNTTVAKATGATRWNSTTPTSTVFSLGTDATVNASGGTYVAYIFAHDAGGFGLTGTDNVISCGSYTGTGAAGNAITLGYEPQWILAKASTSAQYWQMFDVMRGMPVGSSNDAALYPNVSNAEAVNENGFSPTATGFETDGSNNNLSGQTYIYIAIRRPMKVPTVGTSVYNAITRTGTAAAATVTGVGFPPDLMIVGNKTGTSGVTGHTADRLRGKFTALRTNATAAEISDSSLTTDFLMDGVSLGDDSYDYGLNKVMGYVNWFFKRAPSFFDEVCYTGTGSNQNVTHNLGVVPELLIVKNRSNSGNHWCVYNQTIGNTKFLYLDDPLAASTFALWNDTTPTSTVFSVNGSTGQTGASGQTYVAYLFATLAGVSKVGSYTGTGTTLAINCGFTAGARFVLIKRTDSTGDWYVWDSARGIVAGNDPYLLLNSTAAEVTGTDYVDTAASGFEISSTAPAAINANGGSFIFLAIA